MRSRVEVQRSRHARRRLVVDGDQGVDGAQRELDLLGQEATLGEELLHLRAAAGLEATTLRLRVGEEDLERVGRLAVAVDRPQRERGVEEDIGDGLQRVGAVERHDGLLELLATELFDATVEQLLRALFFIGHLLGARDAERAREEEEEGPQR